MSVKQAKEVLKIEAEGILGLIERLGDEFVRAVDLIFKSNGPGGGIRNRQIRAGGVARLWLL